MNILMLAPAVPYPPRQGASLRNYFLLKGLASAHSVSLLSFAEQPPSPDTIEHLQEIADRVMTVPAPYRSTLNRLGDLALSRTPDMGHRLWSAEFERRLAEYLHQETVNWVQIEGIELARYAETVRTHSPNTKILFDNHNAEAALQLKTFETDIRTPARWPAAAYSLIQVWKLRPFERWICETADRVTAVSENDVHILNKLAPGMKSLPIALPNMIDVYEYQAPPRPDDPNFDLVFTGKMDYRPNVDAMRWFLAEIWPLILAQRPETTLAIVGQKPHPSLEKPVKEASNVTLTGFVPEIQPYIRGAKVVIMPLRMGSGTRLKLLEAMASGRAVVSTTLGAAGYPVESGKHLMLADDPESFAQQTLNLLSDPIKRAGFESDAQGLAARYDWRVVTPAHLALIQS